jgi:two-component system, NtrC family, sensor kinase
MDDSARHGGSRAARWQRLLLAVSRSPMIDSGDVLGASVLICDAAAQGLEVERASVWMLAPNRRSMQCIALVDHADPSASNNISLSEDDYPSYFAALAEQRSLAIEDALSDPRTVEFVAGYLRPLGIHALLDTPIRQHADTVGIICAEHRGSPRLWREDEQSFVGNLADLFARALISAERLHYQHELERLNSELERRVDERTRSLQEALSNLESTREQLVEREKFAALGALVAGIAHEVKSPIGVALTAASHGLDVQRGLQVALATGSLTRQRMDEAMQQLGEALDMTQRNISRAVELLDHVKQTAADRTSEKRAVFELGAYVESVLATLSPLLRKRGIRVEIDSTGPAQLDSYPGAIAHILGNLVENAARHGFSPEQRDAQLSIHIARHGDEVELEVADNGAGMDAATLARATEPFFTTAQGRGGTGLGLAIVQSMTERSLGGTLRLDSRPGKGTRALLRIPLVAPQDGTG